MPAEVRPEDEIRHAQRMIDNPEEEEPEGRIAKIINSFSNWNFDINYHNPEDSRNTLLHYCCLHVNSYYRALSVSICNKYTHTHTHTPLSPSLPLHTHTHTHTHAEG